MEFYKIWRGFGGTIGVHKMSLGDLAMNYLAVIIVYAILLGVFVTILPTLLLGIYVLWLIASDMEGGVDTGATEQRLMLNVLTIVSVIYFMIDFHFGLVAFNIVGTMTVKETMDGIAVYNLAIGLLSIFLFFLGHDLYKASSVRLGRVAVILVILFFGMKFTNRVSTFVVTNIITQCDDDESVNGARQRNLDQIRYDNGEYVP